MAARYPLYQLDRDYKEGLNAIFSNIAQKMNIIFRLNHMVYIYIVLLTKLIELYFIKSPYTIG